MLHNMVFVMLCTHAYMLYTGTAKQMNHDATYHVKETSAGVEERNGRKPKKMRVSHIHREIHVC